MTSEAIAPLLYWMYMITLFVMLPVTKDGDMQMSAIEVMPWPHDMSSKVVGSNPGAS